MKIIDFRLRPPYKRFKDVGLFVNLETDTAEIARKMGTDIPSSARNLSMDELIAEMDALGIEKGVVPVRKGQSDNNDDLIDLLQDYPGRFICFAGIDPLEGTEKCLAEIEKYVVEGPCVGIVMELAFGSEPMHVDDERVFPIYQRCQEIQVPVMLQFGGLFVPEQDLYYPNDLDRIAVRFPKLNFIIVHGGYPFITEICHIALNRPNVYISPDCYAIDTIPGYQDYVTAANGSLRDKIVFGTAYPINALESIVEGWKKNGMTEETLEDVMYNNAVRLLGLE